jgi:glycosyltransferase involved in cell wall biosynthesis
MDDEPVPGTAFFCVDGAGRTLDGAPRCDERRPYRGNLDRICSDLCKSYPELDLGKYSHLSNGFDPEDFEGVQAERFDKFTIIHAGNFYEQRSARLFLLGLWRWLERDRQALASTQVLFVERKDPDSTAAIRELGLQDTVTQTGVLPHRRMVASMLGADLLLLVPGPGEGTMPEKIFEYLASRKPVLTIAVEGVARELVCRAGIGSVIYLSDVEGLAAELARLRQAIVGHLFPYPDTIYLLRQYDRRCIAGRLASALDRVIGS